MPPIRKNASILKPAEIPILDEEDENSFGTFKIRIIKWKKITKVKKSDQGTMIFLTLNPKGRAFMAAQNISDELLESNDGVQILLDELEKLFVPDKLRHRMDVFETLLNILENS